MTASSLTASASSMHSNRLIEKGASSMSKFSPDLAAHLLRLDEFEGEGYGAARSVGNLIKWLRRNSSLVHFDF
jgi:hypothetical protein